MDFLTPRGLCQRLNVNRDTLTKLIRKGLPALRVGCRLRFDETEVIRWLRENEEEERKGTQK